MNPIYICNSLLLILLLVCCSSLNAQVNNTEFKIDYLPSQINVCYGSFSSEISVLAKDIGLDSFEITIGMPPGVIYELGSSSIITAPTGYTITEVDITDLSNPVFGISHASLWNAGDAVVFSINRLAHCIAVDHSVNSGTFKEEVFISYNDNGIPKTDSDIDPTVNSYQVNYGVLSILPLTPYLSTVGTVETRDILLRQGGLGCLESFEYNVVVGIDLANYVLSYDSTPLIPTTTVTNQNGTADTLFYNINLSVAPFTNVGDSDNCFENGEEILFQESFKLKGCENTSSFHNANWGCDGSICQAAATQEGVINISNGIPDVKLTILENPRPELCDSVTYVVQITNEGIQTNPPGGSIATDIAIIFGLGVPNTPTATPISPSTWGSFNNNSRFWGNFKINGVSVQDSALYNPAFPGRGPVSFIPPNFYTSDPDGPGGLNDIDGDGYFDDLSTGDTLIVSFQHWITPKSIVCENSTAQYLGFEALNFDVSYENQCGDRILPDHITFNYTNFIRNSKTPSTLEGPADVSDGQVFELEFSPRFLGYSGRYPLCNGEPALTSSSSNWKVTLDLPPGFSIGPNPQLNPTHAGLNPSIVQVGNQVIYTVDHFTQTTFPFQLQLDCSFGSVNPATFNVTSNYECLDDNGDPCWQVDMHCLSIDLRTHCPGIPCVGAVTKSFDANRTTPGWTNPSRTTPVVLDNSGTYNLDYYYPFDTMLISSKGIISDTALTDLFFDVSYSNMASGIDQIMLVNAEVEIGVASTGSVYRFPITNLPTPVTTSADSFKITFDLSSYNELVSPNYLYGGDLNNPGVYSEDSIKVFAYFEVADDFAPAQQFEMTNFIGAFYTINTQGERLECDRYGDRAWFEKVSMNGSGSTSEIRRCEEAMTRFLFCHNSGSGDNYVDLPFNEYRPPYKIDSFKLTLPPSLRFTDTVSMVNYIQNTNVTSYQLTANELVIYPPEDWKDVDKIGTYWGALNIGIIGTCETPINTQLLIPYEWYFKEYYYHPNPAIHQPTVRTATRRVTYTPPTFSIQAQNPNVNGVQQVAYWDVDVCNTNAASDVGYNWFNLEDNPNIQIVSVEDVTGGGSTALTYAYSPDGIYVKIGALNRTECKTIRISAAYTDCAIQTIDVNHSWDCQTYPSSLADDDLVCYRTETLTLNPQPSQIQLSILDQPSVISLCSLLTYELEINSAQLADLVNPYLNVITSNAVGVSVNSVIFEYPAGSGNIETISPTTNFDTLFYNLNNHTQIAANGGLSGTFTSTTPGDRNVLITMEINTNCSFVSGSTLFFQVGGDEPCGAKAIGDQALLISDNLEIPEAISLYDANIAINTNSLPTVCNTSAEVDVQIFITGGSTAGSDSSTITLPVGTSFDPGTFSCTTSAGVFCPTYTVTTVNGQEVLLLGIPVGMNSGDILDFSFEVIADLSLFSQGDSIQIVNTTTLSNIACGNIICSSISAQTGKDNAVLNIDESLGVAAITGNAVSCNLGNDGTAAVTPSGGNAPYSYLWSDGSMAGTAAGLSAGTYTVSITDAKGCVSIATTSIGEPTAIAIGLQPATPSCNSATDGMITAAPSGGTPGYNYQWSTGAATQAISGLSAGTYTVSVTDGNGCVKTAATTINEPAVLGCNLTVTDPTCHSGYNGSAAATVSGGTPGYTYLWDSGAYNQTGQTAYGLNAGNYDVTISDDRGCETTCAVTVGQPTIIKVNVDALDVSCPGLADGEIALSSSGGTPGYSYQWDAAAGGQTVPNITGLTQGTYEVSVTDMVGCLEVVTIYIDTLSCDPCVEFDICAILSADPNHPLATQDSDNDGVTNSAECTDNTDPCDFCDFDDTSITLPVTADQSDCPNLCPDLSPVMTILPGNIAGMSAVEVAIEVVEVNNVDTDGSAIIVRMPSDPRLVFVWNIGLTQAALVPVQNPEWNYLGNNGFVHTWTYNGPGLAINAGDRSALGFQSFYDSQSTDGQTTLTATIIPFGGGECKITNNTDSERLVYFQ